MQSIKNKVISRIYEHGRGWCFSQKDFLDISNRNDVDKALSSLKKDGHIRRINRGLYDYPKFRFKHSEPKVLNVKNRKSALAIQALRYMGQHTVNKHIILKIRAQLSETDRRELLRDARYGTDWIFEVVKKICKQNRIRNG